MIFQAVLFSVFIATVQAECQDVPDGGCSVCGDGLCVGNPDAIFSFPGQQEVACSVLQTAGYSALIPQTECAILPILPQLAVCQCGTSGSSSSPVLPLNLAPVASSLAPVEPEVTDTVVNEGQCPSVPASGCSVCGNGLCVGNPNAIFSYPGQQEVQCGELETAGFNGLVPLESCAVLPMLPQLAVCECGTTGFLSSPVPPPVMSPAVFKAPVILPVTPAPIAPVTGAPVVPATPAPVIPATPAPVVPATPAPVVPVTPAPVVPVTPAPFPATDAPVIKQGGCPSVPDGGCSVCGEGLCIGNADAIFSFPGEQAVACGLLQNAGYNKLIPLDDCAILPILTQIAVCECGTTGLNVSPIVTDTPAPMISPTLAPVVLPTPSPTMAVPVETSTLPSALPSDLPSDFPSNVPSDFPSDVPSNIPSSLPSGSHSPSGSHLPSLVPSANPEKEVMGMKMMGMTGTGVKMTKIGKDDSRRLVGNLNNISLRRVRGLQQL